MRTLVLSHRAIAHELGNLEPWLEEVSGGEFVRAYREDGLPALDGIEFLLVMGSPTSVATGHCAPPAGEEIEFIRDWTRADRPYLGICFGAQALACALGGSVRRMPETYRDYGDISIEPGAPEALRGPWTTWHEDGITMPPDATAMSRMPHADLAFRQGRAWGLQPHIEVTSDTLERMLDGLHVEPATAAPALERIRAAEASDDPPSARATRLLQAFADDALA